MKSLLEFFKLIISWWKDKRKRSFAILIFYLLFFAVLIMMIRLGQDATNTLPKTETKPEVKENFYDTLQNYTYRFTINEKDTLIGKRYLEKESVQYKNKIYYLIDETWWEVSQNELKLPKTYEFSSILWQLTPDMLFSYMKEAGVSSRLNEEESIYLIAYKTILKENVPTNVEGFVKVNVKTEKEQTTITMYLDEYASALSKKETSYAVTLEIMNLNQTPDFDRFGNEKSNDQEENE